MWVKPQVIVFENSLGNFTPTDALQLLREIDIAIPFILIHTSNDEQEALTILQRGAFDYIMSDRLLRLPSVVLSALRQQETEQEKKFFTQVLNDAASVFSFNVAGKIYRANHKFETITGYNNEECCAKNFHQYFSGSFSRNDFTKNQATGKVWKGVLTGKNKAGEQFWLDTVIYANCNENSAGTMFTAVGYNISATKLLKVQIANQHLREKIKIAANTLSVQEKERNTIGQELHNNVNQQLVGIKLLLATMPNCDAAVHEFIRLCHLNIDTAIEENRKISSTLITPDFEAPNLLEKLTALLDSMLAIVGIRVHIDFASFNEALLSNGQKLAVYRIVQEQCSNIVKHAAARNVYLTLAASTTMFNMTLSDDGKGVNNKTEKKGTGLKNIACRIAILNGKVNTVSIPGCGFSLQISFPVGQKRIVAPIQLNVKDRV